MDSYRVDANSGTAFVDVHSRLLSDLSKEETELLFGAMHDAGIESRRFLRTNSPKDSGDYRKGWAMKTERKDGHVTVSVYNATDWQISHLLEDGHKSKNQYGGPYRNDVGPAKPDHHIQVAADRGEEILKKRMGLT